jgi:hypothetical protein
VGAGSARTKYGCCRASSAVMRAVGSYSSMRASRSNASGGGRHSRGTSPAVQACERVCGGSS